MDAFTLITRPEDLARALQLARAQPRVAVDTEAASFHRYVDRIYLIQLTTPAATALIDPLALDDLAPLGALLADPTVEKVFHDADYDLRILDRDYGFPGRHLYDTRIAAHLAGEPAVGLAALLEKYCGVKLSKSHQKADWSRRPLPDGMLAYAAADTRHLLELRAALADRLNTLGRTAWAEEEFGRLESLRWTGAAADGGEAYLRLKGAKALGPRQLAALRELVRWRDERAAAEDKAPFRIVGNEGLVGVARALPATPEALTRVPTSDLPAVLARRYSDSLLGAVRKAMALPESELPTVERGRRPPRNPDLDARIERLKAVRNRVATELGVDPGILCGRGTLEAVARAAPKDRAGLAQVAELRRWQADVLGDALLGAL